MTDGPDTAPPPAEDVGDDDTLANARAALASGHFSIEEAKRTWALTDDEVAQLAKPASPPARTIAQELSEIDKLRTTDAKRYWSPEVQARELELVGMQEKSKEARAKVPPETTDRLSAIAAELRAIDEVRRTSRRDYSDANMQAKEIELLREQETLKLGTGSLPKELVEEWSEHGALEHNLKTARETAQEAFDQLDETEQAEFVAGFDQLPEGAQVSVYRYIGLEPSNAWRPASDEQVKQFADMDPGLVENWGKDAARRLGQLRGRYDLMVRGMSAEDRAKVESWIDGLSPAQARAVAQALTK